MVRMGRFEVSILMEENQIKNAKRQILDALKRLRDEGFIQSAEWKLTYEELPESGVV